ncbi:unnamed protein product [Clonostachys solani]|uniref:Uncharacterized protein n=1 Tax=Clonostachys solani TaxID=160281 RepID=A0A9N9Z064_9HYPO|nr:unnamed protein product [Clonostachys solani]
MAPPKPLVILPNHEKSWARTIRQNRRSLPGTNPSTVSLNNLQQHLNLASKVTLPDWLLLKALFIKEGKSPTPTNLFGEEIGASLEKECRLHLQGQRWWPALESKNGDAEAWYIMGPWRMSQLDFQEEADIRLNKPSTGGRHDAFGIEPTDAYIEPAESSGGKLRIKNDTRVPRRISPYKTIVNAALVHLLQGISLNHPDVDPEFKWTIIHRDFEVSQLRHSDNEDKRKNIMTANVHGFLHVIEPDKRATHCDTLCILETKPVRRKVEPVSIAMAEAVKMAAWISTEHELGLLPSFQSDDSSQVKRRLLVSQNLDEICITVAEYDEEYVRYIANKSSSNASSVRARRNNQRGQHGQREYEHEVESPNDEHDPQSRVRDTQNDDATGRDETNETNKYPRHNKEDAIEQANIGDNTLEDDESNGLESFEYNEHGEDDGSEPYDPDTFTPGFLTMRQFPPIRIIDDDNIGDLMVLLLSITVWLCREHKRSVAPQ